MKFGFRVKHARRPCACAKQQTRGTHQLSTTRIGDHEVEAVRVEFILFQPGRVMGQVCAHFLDKDLVAQPLAGGDVFCAGGQADLQGFRRRGGDKIQ